jgi:hypothetical protein
MYLVKMLTQKYIIIIYTPCTNLFPVLGFDGSISNGLGGKLSVGLASGPAVASHDDMDAVGNDVETTEKSADVAHRCVVR